MRSPTSTLPDALLDPPFVGGPAAESPGASRSRPWRLIAVVTLVALIAGYAGADATKVDKSKLATAEERARTAEASMASAQQRADNAVGIARQQADAALADRSAQVGSREQALNKRQADLDAREASITAAEAARRATSFSDGSYQVGHDIQPGIYHAPGTGGTTDCFWKKLNQANVTTDSYHQPGPAVVVIEPTVTFFSTHGCGVWSKR